MNRRKFLGRTGGSLAALVALGGCTEESLEAAETQPPFVDLDPEAIELPVHQQADVLEAGVLAADGADIDTVGGLEAFLETHELSVESIDETERVIEETLRIEDEAVEVVESAPHGTGLVLELEYVLSAVAETGVVYSIGVVAGGYAALVDAGYDAEQLEATVLDAAHRSFGSFHVRTTWAEEYNDGVVTAREYGAKAWSAVGAE